MSGGQRQRIALARTIARDPAVLVLDEATSALDSDTERTIFANMKDWLDRRTVIVMAHRLATISRFRHVAILADGALSRRVRWHACSPPAPRFAELFAEQLTPVERQPEATVG